MPLEPGTRILDMGCGAALSSIFLAKEFGVEVWAADLWVKPTENWQRITEAGWQVACIPSSPRLTHFPSLTDSSTHW